MSNKISNGKQDSNSLEKKDTQSSKDTHMRTAWIRVTKVNEIQDGTTVTYSTEQIKEILDFWAFESGLTYWFIDHIPDIDDTNDHYHIAIKFKTNCRFSTIKNKFPYGRIEPAKNLRRAIQYLVHLNNPEKLSYSWDQVITNGGDLSEYKVLSRSQQEIRLQSIFEKIDSGEITMLNYEQHMPIDLYSKHSTVINNAFKYKIDKLTANVTRKIKVIYIYGKSGIGKTRFAKDYCKSLYPDEEPYITSSSNDPLQDYKGQKALIWDDFRDSHFRFSDLLKFLDPYTRSSGKSRFYNKPFLGDIIILTSTQRMDFLYKGVSDQSEDMRQLRRRISEFHEFVGDRIRIYLYNPPNDNYIPFKELINPYTQLVSNPSSTGFDSSPYDKMGLALMDSSISTPLEYDSLDSPIEISNVSCEVLRDTDGKSRMSLRKSCENFLFGNPDLMPVTVSASDVATKFISTLEGSVVLSNFNLQDIVSMFNSCKQRSFKNVINSF